MEEVGLLLCKYNYISKSRFFHSGLNERQQTSSFPSRNTEGMFIVF